MQREHKMTEIFLAQNHVLLKSGYEDPVMHQHQAAHILVALEGNIRIRLAEGEYEGKAALIPSGLSHTVHYVGQQVLVFLFDCITMVAEQITKFRLLPDRDAEQMAAAYRKLTTGEVTPESYAQFLSRIIELSHLTTSQNRMCDERVQEAMDYVEEHISEELSVGKVAAMVCLSEGRFSHLFKEQTGITFAGYLLLRKIYHTYLGVADGRSITQAAMDGGFSSPAHFATMNKKLFGITPSDICGEFCLHLV